MPPLAEQQIETYPTLEAPPALVLLHGGGETTPPNGFMEQEPRSREDLMLGDVDDLARHVSVDGLSYEPTALASVRQNKQTAILEGAFTYGRSRVRHEWIPSAEGRGGLIKDLGRTAVETAMRGEGWYRYAESKARGKVEVDHARHTQENLREGIALIRISPRMTRKDGSLEIAKAEGVADTDSIQVAYLDTAGEDNQHTAATTECILAPDVPIEAWVSMLADPKNIFKQSIAVADPESALAVMKAYEGMEIPLSDLLDGPISILAAVVPYIQDPGMRAKVVEHVELFRRTNQEQLQNRAESPAERWLQFDMSTDQSLRVGFANTELRNFITSLEENWGDEDRTVIEQHRTDDGRYIMTRELAAIVQNAQRNMLLTAAAVVTGNKDVLDQLPEAAARAIYLQEMAIQTAHRGGMDIRVLQGGINQIIARHNVKVGGGCSGTNEANFKTPGEIASSGGTETADKESAGTDQYGSLTFKCQVGHVNTRPRGKLIPCCTTCGINVKC